VAFALKQCGLAFSPKSICAVVTGKDEFAKTTAGFGHYHSVYESLCWRFWHPSIPFYRSKTEALWNPSFNSVVLVISPSKVLMEDQLQEIVKYGISGKKLQEELTD